MMMMMKKMKEKIYTFFPSSSSYSGSSRNYRAKRRKEKSPKIMTIMMNEKTKQKTHCPRMTLMMIWCWLLVFIFKDGRYGYAKFSAITCVESVVPSNEKKLILWLFSIWMVDVKWNLNNVPCWPFYQTKKNGQWETV